MASLRKTCQQHELAEKVVRLYQSIIPVSPYRERKHLKELLAKWDERRQGLDACIRSKKRRSRETM